MTELMANPDLRTDATDWTLANAAWEAEDGAETIGCLDLAPLVGAAATAYSGVTAPTVAAGDFRALFTLYAKMDGATKPAQALVITITNNTGTVTYFTHTEDGGNYEVEEWFQLRFEPLLPSAAELRVHFQVGAGVDTHWRIDDISLAEGSIIAGSLEHFMWELRKVRHDIAAMRSPRKRLRQIVNQAITSAPPSLWRVDQNTTLTTVAETRRYALSALTGLTYPWQVERVFMEGEDDHYFEIGLWSIEDDYGVLTLVLDRDPPEADRTIKVEYVRSWPELGDDPSITGGTTTLDGPWIVAKAMILLLMEADPQREDAAHVERQLNLWNARLIERERMMGRRSSPKQMRSTDWRLWR